MTLDAGGVYGQYFHYAGALFFTGAAFILFFYFWSKGKLDMDEEAKEQMMRSGDE